MRWLLVLVFWLSLQPLCAQEKNILFQEKKALLVPTAKIEPFLDGKLSDDLWTQTTGQVLKRIGSQTIPDDTTVVKVSSSRARLYVSFLCHESKMDALVANAINNDEDSIQQDDTVSVLIAPGVLAGAKPFLLTVNSKGVIYDSFNQEKAWNWEGASVVVDKAKDYWSVEMALPLNVFEKDLKKLKQKGWHANFCRVRPKRGVEEPLIVSWQNVSEYEDIDQAGYLFLESLGEKMPDQVNTVPPSTFEMSYRSLIAVQVPKLNLKEDLSVDGLIYEQINAGAVPISFKRLDLNPESEKKVTPKYETKGWLCTVGESLVVSLRCYDKTGMNDLLSTDRIRDSNAIWSDDSVEVFLKIGEEEEQAYYHIAANAHGSLYDSYDRKIEWNGNNIKAAAKRYESYWDIEIQIPFDDLDREKIKKLMGQAWRFNVVRHRPNHKDDAGMEEVAWSPTQSDKSHVPSKFGYIFIEAFNARFSK